MLKPYWLCNTAVEHLSFLHLLGYRLRAHCVLILRPLTDAIPRSERGKLSSPRKQKKEARLLYVKQLKCPLDLYTE